MENKKGHGHTHNLGSGHENKKVKRCYGHIPDDKTIEYPKVNFLNNNTTSHRNLTFLKPKPVASSVNLVTNLPASQDPYDQGLLGSCTANALAFAYVYDEIKQNNPNEFMPSRLFIYYNERKLQGTIDEDSGAKISDGVIALQKYGVCSENQWPYDAPKYTTEPSENLYKIASECVLKTFYTLDGIAGKMSNHVKTALNSGFPVVIGFIVYESFESPEVTRTGLMPMPTSYDQTLGGHCVVIVGCDEKLGFLVRNSWGTNWGCHSDGKISGSTKPRGYFWMPSAFVDSSDCIDFWVLTSVTSHGITGDGNTLAPKVVNLDPGTNNGGVVNPN